ncbi:MAG TPA: PAS domain S-box protein [Gammaproteobacteria bacterium]
MPHSDAMTGAPPSASVPLDSALLESVPAPAFACGADGRILAFNERAAALWGRRPRLNDFSERFCGSLRLLAPDGRELPHEESPLALALRDGKPREGTEVVIVRPDDSRRTVLCYVLPQLDAHGTVTHATAVLVDITRREALQAAAQAALQESEANFRGFFDSAAVGAARVNAAGRFIAVNDRYCEITGYSREELLAMAPFDLDHPDDREADMELVRKTLEDPAGVYHVEKRYVRKDGSITWVHVAVNFVRDKEGKLLNSAAIVLDIGERKRAEEALQEADRLKDEFIATLAHELRNPLAPLKNAVELLHHPDAYGHAWARDVIERQVNHLARLIDDLLDVSRITRDKLELRKERVAMADVINGAVEASRPMLERCEQTLVVALPDEAIYVDGDPVRLTQVFTNLLTNAAKFTEGAGTVEVQAAREGDRVRVSVRDTGIGIDSDELERIFEKFYQSPRHGNRFAGGLGVGLSLVQRIVELHGGTVEARSAGVGRGSELIVRLPVAASLAAAHGAPAAQPARTGVKRIMIVDDNADGADSLARLLELMGHETVTAYDGASALALTKSFPADMILLDLGMPGIDGFEVCRRLREQPGPARTIVALTGWGREQDLARTKQAGFDAHLVKPVDRAALARLIEQVTPASEHAA